MRRPVLAAAHYDCMQWYLRNLFREGDPCSAAADRDGQADARGLSCDRCSSWSRHAGPGDSFTIVHALMNTHFREPRIVLKNTPDVGADRRDLMHRLPNRFVRQAQPAGQRLQPDPATSARDLDSDDVLLIFPEGGNFTESRRERAIARLRARSAWTRWRCVRSGPTSRAPSRRGRGSPGRCPGVDVLLCAHTGLGST